MTALDRYCAAVAALADLGFAAPDPRVEAEVNRAAWSLTLGREHRFLVLPEDVWARLRAATHPGDWTTLGRDPYVRFLPPRVLLGMDREDLAREQVAAAAQAVVRSWLAWQAEVAESAGSPAHLKVIADRLGPDAWRLAVDAGDDVAASRSDAGQLDAAVVLLPLDAAARRELSRFLEALDAAGFDRSAVDVAALLAGLWGGALREPRVAEEWESAATRARSARPWVDLDSHDVAAARVSLLADNSVGGVAPDAWERLVAWAFSRAQRWPRYRTVDPALHSRLIQRWRADRAAGAPLVTQIAGPGLGSEPIWSPFVVEAVCVRRVAESEPTPTPAVVRPAPTVDALMAELDALQGLDEVKARVRELVQFEQLAQSRAARGLPNDPISRHMVLIGNPGTGKTTVARLFGRILHAAGALPSSAFHEVRRSDFIGSHRGETEEKTRALLDKARGGVLFIDEAYALVNGDDDKGGALVQAELVAAMENHRGDLVVIAAGYPGPMTRFLGSNPGLKSRFAATMLFPDLDDAALAAAFEQMLESGGYSFDEGTRQVVQAHFSRLSRTEHFGNAREARNLYDSVRHRLAARHAAAPEEVDPAVITVADVPPPPAPAPIDEEALAAAMAGIERLIGLNAVKQTLQDAIDTARVSRLRWLRDQSVRPAQLGHFAFVGRPGTGKTTVAAHLGQVYRAMGVLRSGHVVTANRSTLVAQYVGQTAPKVRELVRDALDGVLFVDEAYALLPADSGRDFGPEALATLVEEMEANRDRLVVVLAGYPREMERLLAGNAGLSSRVRTTVRFEDFSREELLAIALAMASERGLVLDPEAADRIAAITDAGRREVAFANARTVRNLLDDAVNRQARRLAPQLWSRVPTAELARIRVQDLPDSPVVEPSGGLGLYL